MPVSLRQFILQDPDDSTRKASLDSISQVLRFIDYEHSEVHSGDTFHCQATDTSMANTNTLVLAFKTENSTKRVHMILTYTTLLGGTFEILEGATWTQGTGTLQTIFNHKRLATMTSSTLLEDQGQPTFTASDAMIANPTITGTGTRISLSSSFGVKNQIGAGGGRDINEWILKPDTQYAIRFTSTINANKGEVTLEWYEHTDN